MLLGWVDHAYFPQDPEDTGQTVGVFTLSDLRYPDMDNTLNTSWQLVQSMQLTG